MKLSLPWPQNSVEALSSLSCGLLYVIKTGHLTSMHEMSVYKCKNRPSGSNQSCVACLAKHHLLRTRPHRGETQSRCLLFGNRGTVSSYTPDRLPRKNMASSTQGSGAILHVWISTSGESLLKLSDELSRKSYKKKTAAQPQKERERELWEISFLA